MYTGLENVWGNFYRLLVKAGLLPIVPPTFVSVDNIADLKALTTRPDIVITRGYNTENDGGGGPPWQWVAASTATIDDFMAVSPTGAPSGRYIRQLQAGANVSPKWAGCGLGAANDTAQFQKVIDFGAAIDASGGTYPVLNLAIAPTTTCPRIFSDGSGVMTVGPGAVTSTNIFICTKDDFAIDRIAFDLPTSTDPVTGPDASSGFRHTGAAGSRIRITNCRHVGGHTFCYLDGEVDDVWITDNVIEGTWSDSIDVISGVDVHIARNTINTGGFSTAATSGAIRTAPTVGGSRPSRNLVITDNIIRAFALFGQSAIDCYASGASNILIANNLVDQCGSGIELKTDDTALSPDIYQFIKVSGNLFNCSLLGSSYVAIALNSTTASLGSAKAGRVLISDNYIQGDGASAGSASFYGIVANVYFDTTIAGNYINGTSRGIEIAPTNSGSYDGLWIDDNVIDVVGAGITLNATGFTFNNPHITNNDVIGGLKALTILNAATIGALVKDNYFRSTSGDTCELRNLSDSSVTGNTIVSDAGVAILGQSVALTNVKFTDNDLISVTADAMNLGIGTGIEITGNRVTVPATKRTIIGAATYLSSDNLRGIISTEPGTTYAGSLGDRFLNGAPALYGPKEWVCTTLGASGVAVYSVQSQLGGLQRAQSFQSADVNLNNTANFFNGPNTGSIGAAGQVWQITAMAQIYDTVPASNFIARIHDGTNPVSAGVGLYAGTGLNGMQIVCSSIVTLTAATTFTLQARDQSATSGVMVGSTTIGVNCTFIQAVRLL